MCKWGLSHFNHFSLLAAVGWQAGFPPGGPRGAFLGSDVSGKLPEPRDIFCSTGTPVFCISSWGRGRWGKCNEKTRGSVHFFPFKNILLFPVWVFFRVLINLENKNNFQTISAMVNRNASQAGLIVPGSYNIPVGAVYEVPGWFERTACPRYKCQSNWKCLLTSRYINQQRVLI